MIIDYTSTQQKSKKVEGDFCQDRRHLNILFFGGGGLRKWLIDDFENK